VYRIVGEAVEEVGAMGDYRLAVLPGDSIGPEVIAEAGRVPHTVPQRGDITHRVSYLAVNPPSEVTLLRARKMAASSTAASGRRVA
jgi:isocitrate/isopropylmalate dehydrogenase